MSFTEAAQFVVAHPIAVGTGTVVGVVLLWKGAKAMIRAAKEEEARQREMAERWARISKPTPWPPKPKTPKTPASVIPFSPRQ